MVDACHITRPGDTVTDPITGLDVTGTDTVYVGKCKVQTTGGLAGENVEGSAPVNMGAVSTVWSLRIDLPYGTTGLRTGDTVEITAATDATLTGRRYRLIGPQSEKSLSTACRWNVKEAA